MKGGSESEEQTGKDSEAAGEGEHAPVDVRIGEARRVRRQRESEQTQALRGKQNPKESAEQSKQNTFGEKLADHAAAVRTHGSAYGNFLLPGGGTGKCEIGDIDAGDEKNQADSAEKEEEAGAHVCNHAMLQFKHADVCVPRNGHGPGKQAGYTRLEQANFGAGLIDSSARTQTADDWHEIAGQ